MWVVCWNMYGGYETFHKLFEEKEDADEFWRLKCGSTLGCTIYKLVPVEPDLNLLAWKEGYELGRKFCIAEREYDREEQKKAEEYRTYLRLHEKYKDKKK